MTGWLGIICNLGKLLWKMGKVDDWQTDLWDGEQVSSFEVNNNTQRNKSALASSLSIDNYGPTSTNKSEMTRSCW